MNKKLIKQLADGYVILKNTDKKNLLKVLNAAWPNHKGWYDSAMEYYYAQHSVWNYCNILDCNNTRPIIETSEFLKEDEEEFVWGDQILFRGSGSRYIYIGLHPLKETCCITVNVEFGASPYTFDLKSIYKYIAPKVKELTLKEIAEKFGLPVEQIRIKD